MGTDDPFDYSLALELGWSHAAITAMPYEEYIRWRAYFTWREVQRKHARDVAEMRAAR